MKSRAEAKHRKGFGWWTKCRTASCEKLGSRWPLAAPRASRRGSARLDSAGDGFFFGGFGDNEE